MMQHLLRRLVFDVPLLNEHAKMPLKVSVWLFDCLCLKFCFPLLASLNFDAGKFLPIIVMAT